MPGSDHCSGHKLGFVPTFPGVCGSHRYWCGHCTVDSTAVYDVMWKTWLGHYGRG